MSSKQKVYLSLDDIYKLYGIRPESLSRKKKKKGKKKKKNNAKGKQSNYGFGTGVNKSFGGGGGGIGGVLGVGHVQGASIDRRELDILRGQLNDAKNNPQKKHDGILKLEHVPEELKNTLTFAKMANEAYNKGDVNMYKSTANNLVMGLKKPKQKKRITFDIEKFKKNKKPVGPTTDHTINPAPPITTSNDLTNTGILQFMKSNDDIESDEDIFTDSHIKQTPHKSNTNSNQGQFTAPRINERYNLRGKDKLKKKRDDDFINEDDDAQYLGKDIAEGFSD